MMKRMVAGALLVFMGSGAIMARKREAQESLPAGYQQAFGPGKTGTWKEIASANFFRAIARGDIDAAKDIIIEGSRIDEKIGVDIKDAKGNTPLFYAPDLDTVKFLITNGANVNAQNNEGLAPLHVQVVMGRPEIVRYLLEHNADANIKTKTRVTPLHLSTMIAFLADRQKLREAMKAAFVGAFVGGAAGFAVAAAAGLGAIGFIGGAGVGALAGQVGLIALVDITVRNKIMGLLLQHGARADVQDVDRNTPLHTLANGEIVKTKGKLRRGGVLMAEQLLAWGNVRDIDLRSIQNNDGMTPYAVAMNNGRLLLAPLLDPRLPRPVEKGVRKLIDMNAP